MAIEFEFQSDNVRVRVELKPNKIGEPIILVDGIAILALSKCGKIVPAIMTEEECQNVEMMGFETDTNRSVIVYYN
jgi:hypothetical protein